MLIHLLSSRSSSSGTGTGHPHHLPDDLSTALREVGHQVEVDLLGDALDGQDLTSLSEGANAGRKIAARLNPSGSILHALDPVAWAAALTARSLTSSSVVLRFSEPALSDGSGLSTDLGSSEIPRRGSGRVSTIDSATERRAYQACLRAADAVAAVGDTDRTAAVRAGVPVRRALLVPDVVGLSVEPADAAIHPGSFVLSLSGIGQGSGIKNLLAGLRWAPGRELLVAGPGGPADEADFRSAVKRFEVADRVTWRGWLDRTEVLRLLDSAAMLVLPSPTTGVTAAIEAMARGRAVATVDGGAAAAVVVDGITGSVLPAGNPEQLGHTLRTMLGNPFQLEAMGLAGRERALTRYARRRAVSATEEAYRVALGVP
jgi:glycosyltransferase involved in cell wall biosynthesis